MKLPVKHSRRLKTLPALLLAVLLCACGAAPAGQETVSPAGTLPEIGILVPESGETSRTEPSASESTQALPETPTVPEESTASETAAPQTSEAETLPASSAEPQTAPSQTPAETSPETSEPQTVPPETEPLTEPETEPPAPTQPAASGVRVWMGDSRFVGIRDTVDHDPKKDVFISGWGMGYKWMLETAFPAFDALSAEQKIDICYWSLGANDITNDPSEENIALAAKYVAEVTKLMARHPSVTFYLLSYGPVGEEGMDPNNIPDCASYNKALRIFTDYIRDHTEMRYLDQGEYIEKTGFRVYDGCHYDAETNKRAYAYILEQSGQQTGK